MISLFLAWTSSRSSNRVSSDVRRITAHMTSLKWCACYHYSDVIMISMASQITGVSIVYSNFCSGADQRKRKSSASLAFVRGIHRWPVDSPHKGPVTRKMFPFDDVMMIFFISLPSWRYHPSASVHTLFPRWRILPEWTSWWPPGFSLDHHRSWSPQEPSIFPPSSSPSSWRLKGMGALLIRRKVAPH